MIHITFPLGIGQHYKVANALYKSILKEKRHDAFLDIWTSSETIFKTNKKWKWGRLERHMATVMSFMVAPTETNTDLY